MFLYQSVIKEWIVFLQDGMVNAVSKSSRLIGCYHHHPHVIPLPSTTSLHLTEDDEFLVIANAPFWACITHREAVNQVRNIADSKMAASKLRDLALAYGSKEEISVIVVRFLNSRFVPQYRKLATSQHSDVKTSRPKTSHGESGLHYSTASLGRVKHREPVDTENPLQRRTKSIYSVTTQPQKPKVTAPSYELHDDSPANENSRVVMRKTKSDNERHQKALSASPYQIPIHIDEPVSQSEYTNIHTNFVNTSKGSSQESKAITKKKTESKNETGRWETKNSKNDSHKKTPGHKLPTNSNEPANQKNSHTNLTNYVVTAKGSPRETKGVRKNENHKTGGWETNDTKDHHKKASYTTPNQIPSINNKQVTQPQPETVHVNPTNNEVTKKIKSQPKTELQHKIDHVDDYHKEAKSTAANMTPREPVGHLQHIPDHATVTSRDDKLIPTDSHDDPSSFNTLHHSSSDSLADQSPLDQSTNQSLLNQSMDATWFESMPPLQLDDGFDTFGLELGMLSEMATKSNEATTDNVVFGGQKDWGAKKQNNEKPTPSVMDAELEEAKANFNFDELIAGLNNTWMTTLDSIPNTASNTTPTVNNVSTKSPMRRDDSILSESLMAQFEQEANEELDNLISKLNEFVDDPY